jgi:Restriction endonuclease BglII
MDLTTSYSRVFATGVTGRYELRETRSAAAVLQNTNPQEFADLVAVLTGFQLVADDVLLPGGNEGPVAKRLNQAFRGRGWREGQYDARLSSELRLMPYRPAGETKATVVTSEVLSTGYKVDNVKGGVALDVEWNAKDGNLDRDVAAYRSLYDAGIIAVGVMITRAQDDTRALSARLGGNRFATTTTTNLEKLEPRMTRGDAGGCPMLAIAITSRCMTP